jgi:diguanylate cyclase (GGDEF)-like protein
VSSHSPAEAVRWADEPATQVRRWRRPSPPDAAILERLASVEKVCVALAGAIGALILGAWLIPAIAPLFFPGWALMKANTALLTLLSAASLALSRSEATGPRRISRVLAAVVALVAAMVLLEYLSRSSFGIDTLLAADRGSPQPGRMSPQTTLAFLLLGVILLLIRVTSRGAGIVVDFLVFCLCPLVMVIVSGYAFGVLRFFGLSAATRTSPHTLVALMLLSFVAFSRRAEIGIYSVLTGPGIGSRIARIAAPLALIVPFALEAARFSVAKSGLLSESYVTALITAMVAVLGFALVLVLAWRIDSLEQEIRDLSIRDELTSLYNRRGFFLLADRELRLARRAQVPFSVLFLDLDGLKQVNDTLGHESGSEFLREIAELIHGCFRESDIAGRIGGDEFVIAAVASAEGIAQAAGRLQLAAADCNAKPGRRYPLEFSFGTSTLDASRPDSLEELLKRADQAMYAAKHSKRRLR